MCLNTFNVDVDCNDECIVPKGRSSVINPYWLKEVWQSSRLVSYIRRTSDERWTNVPFFQSSLKGCSPLFMCPLLPPLSSTAPKPHTLIPTLPLPSCYCSISQRVIVFTVPLYFTDIKVKPLDWLEKECQWRSFAMISYYGPGIFQKNKR